MSCKNMREKFQNAQTKEARFSAERTVAAVYMNALTA